MIIRAKYNEEEITITTRTNEPDAITSFVLDPQNSMEAAFLIDEATFTTGGAYGLLMKGIVTNRDLVAMINSMPEFEVVAVEPPLPVYKFPPRVAT